MLRLRKIGVILPVIGNLARGNDSWGTRADIKKATMLARHLLF